MSPLDAIFGYGLLSVSAVVIAVWAIVRLYLAVRRTGSNLDTFLTHERGTWQQPCRCCDREES